MRKRITRVYRFTARSDTISVVFQGAGGASLALAGWLYDPIAGLVVGGVVLLIWSGRTPGRSN